MNKEIIDRIDEVLPELLVKESEDIDPGVYASIARQLEFIKECFENGMDYKEKLGDKKLNFGVLASRNFSGPEENLGEKIGHINYLLIRR